MKTALPRLRPLLVVLAGLVITVAPSGSRADGLDRYTGYTRPGTPPDRIEGDKVITVALDDKKAIGGTVYFRVYDLSEGSGSDSWNTGFKNLDTLFRPGVDATGRRSPTLDRSARYLYVYQALNDRGTNGKIQSVTIRLLVDPSRITSWGHFEGTKDADVVKGISFAVPVGDKEKVDIIPVSSEHPDIGATAPEKAFRSPANHYPTPRTPIIIPSIRLNNPPAADDPATENVGRVPDGVVLMRAASFDGAPRPEYPLGYGGASLGFPPILAGPYLGPPWGAYGYGGYGLPWGLGAYYPAPFMPPNTFFPGTAIYGPAVALPAITPVGYTTATGLDGYGPDRYAAIRADFTDPEAGPLDKKQRSTIFGFTSNDPPTYDVVRIRGSSSEIRALAPGITVPANLQADGGVPVPVAFEQGAAGVAGVSFPFLGGTTTTGTTFGGGAGAGFPGAGIGAIGVAPAGTTGGGGFPTNGGQNQNGNQQQAQQQQQQNQQQQQQAQQQQQQQQQQQNRHHKGHVQVVPEPAAVVTALLGLPALWALRRRKRTQDKVAA
jgi:hypothetical protein